MNPIVIVLGIILVLLVYILYTYYSNTSATLSSTANLNNYIPVIPTANINNPTTTRYAYSIWVYVNSWPTPSTANRNTYKPTIFSVSPGTGTIPNGDAIPSSLKLYLDPMSPILYCDIGMTNSISTINITNNFPIQKWTYITVSLDNQFMDCYLDGKLILSTKLLDSNNLPPPNPSANSSIQIGLPTLVSGTTGTTGIDIYSSKFQRYISPLDPQTVWTNYLSGNGKSSVLSSSYGMNVSILKDNSLQHMYQII